MDIQEELNKIIASSPPSKTMEQDITSLMKNKSEHRKTRLDCLLLIIQREYRRKHGLSQSKIAKLYQLAEIFRNELNKE